MGQPVIDTLKLSDALRETGMEREQAEGLGRSLGSELGAHVAVRSDLEAGFQGVRSDLRAEIQQVRTDLEAKIEKVRTDLDAKIDRVHAELSGQIEALRAEMRGLNSRLTLLMTGFALLFSALTVASGMRLFARAAPPAVQPAVVAPASPPTGQAVSPTSAQR